MIRLFVIAILMPICTVGAYAQVTSASPAGRTPADMIDGAKNPTLVPDSTAYRLFFLAASETPDATSQRQLRQRAVLAEVGLNDTELASAIVILNGFKTEYAERIKQYNDTVARANAMGIPPDLAGFLRERDLLVQITRDALRSSLSPEAMARFDAHVQEEKRHMLVAKEIQ